MPASLAELARCPSAYLYVSGTVISQAKDLPLVKKMDVNGAVGDLRREEKMRESGTRHLFSIVISCYTVSYMMPPRARKDISNDLKQATIRSVESGSSYRQVAALIGVSVGTVSSVVKVFISLFYVHMPSNIYSDA